MKTKIPIVPPPEQRTLYFLERKSSRAMWSQDCARTNLLMSFVFFTFLIRNALASAI